MAATERRQVSLPMMMLITTGRKSGLSHRTPLLYAETDRGMAVVTSNFGSAYAPAWSENLLANPEATVVIGGEEIQVRAELLSGPDRETAWNELLQLWPAFGDYAAHASGELRVFSLAPQADSPAVHLSFVEEYDVPAATMWSHINDFHTIAAWHPCLASSAYLEEQKRECIAEDGGHRFVEVLDDTGTDGERIHRYRIIDGPPIVSDYRATIQVHELLGDRCAIAWDAYFNEGAAAPIAVGEQIFTNFLRSGLDALAVWAKENVD